MAQRRVVVVTGASGGIGRAAAEQFGRRGDDVGLLARGRAGLRGAARAVQQGGGRALAVPTDVADFAQVQAAADRIEGEFGAIDIWVNVAFASVFAPFVQITPEEFRRITEVTYLGFVHGTRVALDRMLPRDRGTIVQVGSALGYRSIPLQSAYCGAKHAINGFSSAVRTELMHERSRVRLTVVQMPAVNTPQFTWVVSRLPRHPQPVPPIFQPELAADAVLYAADHPGRKQYWVGTSTALTIAANKIAAPLLDRYVARTAYDSQQTSRSIPQDRPGNLWQPLDDEDGYDHGAHGAFDDVARSRDVQITLSRHAGWIAGAVGAAGLGGITAAIVRAARR